MTWRAYNGRASIVIVRSLSVLNFTDTAAGTYGDAILLTSHIQSITSKNCDSKPFICVGSTEVSCRLMFSRVGDTAEGATHADITALTSSTLM